MKRFLTLASLAACLLFLYVLVGLSSNATLKNLQGAKTLRAEAQEMRQRLEWEISDIEKGINYIAGNSNLGVEESGKVFSLCPRKSHKHDIPLNLLLPVIKVESHFNQVAVSNKGAMGIMQLMPKTAEELSMELGLSYDTNKLYDMEYNMELGCYFLNKLHSKYQDWDKALSHYNSGKAKNLTYLKLINPK